MKEVYKIMYGRQKVDRVVPLSPKLLQRRHPMILIGSGFHKDKRKLLFTLLPVYLVMTINIEGCKGGIREIHIGQVNQWLAAMITKVNYPVQRQ